MEPPVSLDLWRERHIFIGFAEGRARYARTHQIREDRVLLISPHSNGERLVGLSQAYIGYTEDLPYNLTIELKSRLARIKNLWDEVCAPANYLSIGVI